MSGVRCKIYNLVSVAKKEDRVSLYYDIFMMISIILSVVPLTFKNQNKILIIIDYVTVTIFIIDYILRLITADYEFGNRRISSFLKYPFTPMAIVDMICILPTFLPLTPGFKVLKIIRLVRTIKVLRIVKTFRYSKSIIRILNVIKKTRNALIAVLILAIGYILITALIMFNAEPQSFVTFFDAIYWATISLTTVGYGDIYAITTIGKIVTMISSFFGVAIIALPSGIITAGYIKELDEENKK